MPLTIPVGKALLGRVITPLGSPIDNSDLPVLPERIISIYGKPPNAATRPPITEPFETGIRAIDGFCTLGMGQRMAICASAGVGKSTLLASITRGASADVVVVALVGERGREVREFIDNALGAAGLQRSVIVVATSDDSSLLRQTAPYTATAIAEYFRDQGLRVLLIVDSLTRMARAIRETSIAAGELPVRQGYTNSVYMLLPRLLERAGTSPNGSITALYTVLTNQDNDTDPLADEVKSLVDGHIVLREELASKAVFPAIDVTASISRLFERVTDAASRDVTYRLRYALSRLWKDRELALLGGVPDSELRKILDHQEALLGLIKQDLCHGIPLSETRKGMLEVIRCLT
jgi:FliI/YscN family ATPase